MVLMILKILLKAYVLGIFYIKEARFCTFANIMIISSCKNSHTKCFQAAKYIGTHSG